MLLLRSVKSNVYFPDEGQRRQAPALTLAVNLIFKSGLRQTILLMHFVQSHVLTRNRKVGVQGIPSEGYASHSLLPRGSCHAGDAEEVVIRDGTNSTSQEVCHIMDGRVMIPPREHTTASLIVYGRSCVSNVSKRVSLSACVVHVSVNRDIKLYPETSTGG